MFSCEFCRLFKTTLFVEDLKTAGSETPERRSEVANLTARNFKENFFAEDL